MNSFKSDMSHAKSRFSRNPGHVLQTHFGRLEYLDEGQGPDVLFSHGVLGSYLDGLSAAKEWVGEDIHGIAPSRFGYFGSEMPRDASAAAQADAFVELLDHLEIARVVAVGFSAGGPSVIQLALRHPDRVSGLVLASSRLPGLPKPNQRLRPILHFVFGADWLFWTFKRLIPRAYAEMMGVPKTHVITADERGLYDEIAESFFPLKPRQEGATFDGFVSNVEVDDMPLEEIVVPTLIIHSQDDPLALYYSAEQAARRIPGARLVTMPEGGHLFLGRDRELRNHMRTFIETVREKEGLPV